MVLTINGYEFNFSHKKSVSKEIKSISALIKESIDMIEESKYDDIRDSRVQEIVNKLKRLVEISTLEREDFERIKKIIKDYAEEIKSP